VVALSPPPPPRRTGRRQGWRAADYVALDFETTGLDYRRDAIVSYGAVPVIGGRARLDGSTHQLVRPAVPPTPRSQTVHLLRPADLAEAPDLGEAREGLRSVLARRFLLAWFAEVELRFLRRAFGGSARRWRRRTIDVRNLAIAVDGKPAATRTEMGYGLTAVANRYSVPVANPHEAFDDALVTAQLFLVLASKLPGIEEPTVRDLLAVGRP
jgi:DNA polymerase III subunit epsilon